MVNVRYLDLLIIYASLVILFHPIGAAEHHKSRKHFGETRLSTQQAGRSDGLQHPPQLRSQTVYGPESSRLPIAAIEQRSDTTSRAHTAADIIIIICVSGLGLLCVTALVAATYFAVSTARANREAYKESLKQPPRRGELKALRIRLSSIHSCLVDSL